MRYVIARTMVANGRYGTTKISVYKTELDAKFIHFKYGFLCYQKTQLLGCVIIRPEYSTHTLKLNFESIDGRP